MAVKVVRQFHRTPRGATRGMKILMGLAFCFSAFAMEAKDWPTITAEDGKHITAKGLASLSDEDADDLAGREWAGLNLKEVTEISDSALARLAGHDGKLVLTGLTDLSLPAARSLGEHAGELLLDGITAASDDVLECLSANRKGMTLSGLRELSDRGAEILGTKHEGFLSLDGVLALSETQAAHLAGHQGIVYLLGVKSLTPEASHALATNAYGIVLPDSPDFSEDIRRRLSGHCAGCSLGFVDLPQYFGPDPAWRSASVGGLPIADALVRSAVIGAVGEKGTGTEPLELGGVRLGTPFRDLRTDDGQPNVFFEEVYHTFVVTKPAANAQADEAPTMIKVDALTGNVVCIHRQMLNTSFSEVMQSIVERFGKTPQEIVEVTFADGLFSSKRTIIRYAYPRAIARIQEFISVNRRSGHESSEVVVSLLSRPWVEESLNAYGNSVLTACQWAIQAQDAFDGKAFPVNDIPVLPGTERRAAAEGTHAFFVDAARQQWAQRAKNFRKDGFLKRAYRLMPSPIVAAVGTVPTEDGKAVAFIAIRPLLSTSAGLRPIMTVDRYSGTNDISETPANDMLKEVANPLVQKCFPPTTDKISVIKVQRPPDVTLGQMLNNEGGVREINAMYRQSEGSRYEWQCRDGWTVRVCFDGHVYLLKTPQKAID